MGLGYSLRISKALSAAPELISEARSHCYPQAVRELEGILEGALVARYSWVQPAGAVDRLLSSLEGTRTGQLLWGDGYPYLILSPGYLILSELASAGSGQPELLELIDPGEQYLVVCWDQS